MKQSGFSNDLPPLAQRRDLTLLLGLLLVLTATLPGCGGCAKKDDQTAEEKKKEEEKKKKEKEKPKPDFEVQNIRVQPMVDVNARLVKSGHWMTVSQRMLANNFHFNGRIDSAATDLYQNPVPMPNTPYHMTMTRPASLAKGQPKHFESTFFIPRGRWVGSNSLFLQNILRAKGGGVERAGGSAPARMMPDYQYVFLVLSSQVDKYGYLKRLDSISVNHGDEYSEEKLIYYQVSLPDITQRVPLSSQGLTWSSLAFILWDDVDPSRLTPRQQQALLDWLYWGGQMVISGPNSLEALRNSFLADYLPAEKEKAVKFDQTAFDQLNAHWSFPEQRRIGNRNPGGKGRGPRLLTVLPDKPLVGIELKKHPQAEYLPNTGEMVVERRVGRGRIVTTAFSLTSPAIVNWPGYDGFFNACLLRRPAREFSEPPSAVDVQVTWRNHPKLIKDARLISALRYFTRDIGQPIGSSAGSIEAPWATSEEEEENGFGPGSPGPIYDPSLNQRPKHRFTQAEFDPPSDHWHFGGYRPAAFSGVAGWNDSSGASTAARQALTDAAGITIPSPGFVVRVLAIYLVILVPVNWGFFRLIRRVEWAWAAAPVIAIGGAVVVIYSAQLDIGFARSRTEIIVLEGYGGYARAHATRYTALYTSLSTGYELGFDDDTSLAQPFASDEEARGRVARKSDEIRFRRESKLRMTGFQVNSNSTDMLHSEQMIDLGGAIRLAGDPQSGFVLENPTRMKIREAGLLRRNDEGKLEVAWIGDLQSGASVPVRFSPAPGGKQYLRQWEASPTMRSLKSQLDRFAQRYEEDQRGRYSRDALRDEPQLVEQFELWDSDGDAMLDKGELSRWFRRQRAGQFSLGELADLACRRLELSRGEIRLVGWSDETLPGLDIRPRAAQSTYRTLILMHLKGGELPTPRRDKNCRADFVVVNKARSENDLNPGPESND